MVKKYKINLNKVWKHYPNPISSKDGTYKDGDYCVLGALDRYCNKYIHKQIVQDNIGYSGFPGYEAAASFLRVLNPNIRAAEATYFAKMAIQLNDKRDFALAKNVLKQALEKK